MPEWRVNLSPKRENVITFDLQSTFKEANHSAAKGAVQMHFVMER